MYYFIYLFFRTEGESVGHVRREVQTFQRHQVHDQGRKVPGPDIEALVLCQPLDRTTKKTEKGVYQDGLSTFQGSPSILKSAGGSLLAVSC